MQGGVALVLRDDRLRTNEETLTFLLDLSRARV